MQQLVVKWLVVVLGGGGSKAGYRLYMTIPRGWPPAIIIYSVNFTCHNNYSCKQRLKALTGQLVM